MRYVGSRALLGALLALILLVSPAGARVAPADPPPPAAEGGQIAAAFAKLSRDTSWQLIRKVPLKFNAYHPEGIVRLGDRYVLSAVEVIEPTQKYQPPGTIIDGTDRTPGKGVGHLLAFDNEGNLLADRHVAEADSTIYHPGGLDYDGRDLWLAVAEYRPNKPSIIYRVDPESLVPREVLRSPDHIGGIVHDTRRHRILGLNWGSRKAYEWKLTGHGAVVTATVTNPSYFVDYQDCKYLGRPRAFKHPAMLCSGIATLHHVGPDGQPVNYDLGGVAEVDVTTMRPLDEVPFQEYTDQRQVATRNALDVQVVNGHLRLYLVADDNQSNLLIYEAR